MAKIRRLTVFTIEIFSFLFLSAFTLYAAPPTVGVLAPSSGSSVSNEEITFTTTYIDPDGWQDLNFVKFIVGNSVYTMQGLNAIYYRQQNLIKIFDPSAPGYNQSCTPGSAVVLNTATLRLDCSQTVASGSGDTLSLTWRIAFKAPFLGIQKMYLYARDMSPKDCKGVGSSGYVLKGTWTVLAGDLTAPVTTANPPAGVFTDSVDVTLTANEPATIYYTTDGSIPTTASTVYSAPIHLTTDTTLKFFAVDTAGNAEAVQSLLYEKSTGPTNIPGGTISTNTTWTRRGSPYILQGSVTIAGTTTTPAVLTIEPGTEIRFPPGINLSIGTGSNLGALVAQGTPALPILFTRSTANTYWRGIYFNDATADALSIMEHCIVEYGGDSFSSQSSNITLISASPTLRNLILRNSQSRGMWLSGAAAPTISNSVIRDNQWGAVLLSGATPTFQNNTFQNNADAAVSIGLSNGASTFISNTYTGNRNNNTIEIRSDTLSQSVILKKQDAPYWVSGIPKVAGTATTPATLTIEPGTEIRFDNGGLHIGSGPNLGALIAQGTSDNPILFTRFSPNTSWYGIEFYGHSVDAVSIMEHCIVEYTGFSPNITLDSASPILKNLTLRGSQLYGLYLSNASPTVTDSIIQDSRAGAVSIDLMSIESTFVRNAYSGNGSNLIEIRDGILSQSRTMKKQDTPYQVHVFITIAGTAATPATLTIEPGTEIRFESGAVLNIGSGSNKGALVAQGTLENLILFTRSASNIYWYGIYFNDATDDVASIMEHCIVEYGGFFRFFYSDSSNITLVSANPTLRNLTLRKSETRGMYLSNASPTIEDSTVRDNQTGITIQGGSPAIRRVSVFSNQQGFSISGLSNPAVTKSIIRDNTQYGFYLSGVGGNPAPVVNDSSIYNNTSYNVYTTSFSPSGDSVVLDFQNNWWNTTDSAAIEQKIHHFNDSASLPLIDFSPFLGALPFQVHDFQANPAFFSPNGDGQRDTTTVTGDLGQQGNWTLSILDSANAVVRTFTGLGTTFNVSWDGRDQNGNPVPDGLYTIRIEAEKPDHSETITPAYIAAGVDRIAPVAEITIPGEDEILFGSTKFVTGTASDSQIENYVLEFGQGSAPASFSTISSGTDSTTDAYLGNWNIGALVTNGPYLLRLTVRDKAQQTSVVNRLVTLDDIRLANIGRSTIQINPLLSETTTISYTIDRQANVTFKLFDEATDAVVKTFVNNQSQAQGTYQFAWDGKNDSGVLLPLKSAYYFTIEAHSEVGQIDKYTPSVRGASFSGSNVTDFNPYANDLLAATFNLNYPARQSLDVFVNNQIVYNLTASEPFTNGNHTIYWDGRDAGGNLVATGASYSILQYVPQGLPENVIITRDETLKVDSLRANAYVIVPTFGEVSRITYSLVQDAHVTLNIKDPNGNHFKNVITNESQTGAAGPYEYWWDGTNDDGNYVTIPGHYTLEFFIENTARTDSIYRRGNVTVAK